jgi:hypothetical protein
MLTTMTLSIHFQFSCDRSRQNTTDPDNRDKFRQVATNATDPDSAKLPRFMFAPSITDEVSQYPTAPEGYDVIENDGVKH